MKTVTITEDFDGYPAGKRESFRAGETREVSEAFGALIVEKGHAREVAAAAPETETEAKPARKSGGK